MWFPGFTPWNMRATTSDQRGAGACRRDLRVESNERRPARAGVHVVMSTAAREGLMREHEAGRGRSPWHWHPWFKRISQAVTQVSVLLHLATGAGSSIAARKNKSNRDDSGGGERSDKDRERDDKSENDRNGDGRLDRENSERADRGGVGRDSDRERRQERRGDDSSDDSSGVIKKQKSDNNEDDDSNNTNDGNDTSDPNENDNTSDPDENDDTSGGGGNGGRGDGGGNDAGSAGSNLFDSPLATKARRRANDFDNADDEDEDDGTFADVDPDSESVYETDSIFFATGPDGVEIVTNNITYFADPPPPPEPLPRLELPIREPGFPFGEDFPFGDMAVTTSPTEPEPSDPGDTGTAPPRRAEPIPAADEPEPTSSDGGDNTMDFSS
jgi:hypothetical protein